MMPYIRLESSNSLEARKSILASQMILLNIAKRINSYQSLRRIELTKKYLLKQALREGITKISSLIAFLPRVETKMLKSHISAEISEPEETSQNIQKSNDIESQLSEIREKLASLNA